MRSRVVAVLLCALCLPWSSTPAQADQIYPTQDAKRIEAALAELGLPVGKVDGVWDANTARATCAWRELTARPVLRSWPTVEERSALKSTTSLTVPAGLWVGVNVDLQCQTAYWIVKGKITESNVETMTETLETVTATGESATVTVVETSTVVTRHLGQILRRVMPVSTGRDGYDTAPGKHFVRRVVSGWWQSTIYVDGHMYRPMFFHRGQALHGSSSDSLVVAKPDSHGCIRMLHADMDALWGAGFGRGDVVSVYGKWKG